MLTSKPTAVGIVVVVVAGAVVVVAGAVVVVVSTAAGTVVLDTSDSGSVSSLHAPNANAAETPSKLSQHRTARLFP